MNHRLQLMDSYRSMLCLGKVFNCGFSGELWSIRSFCSVFRLLLYLWRDCWLGMVRNRGWWIFFRNVTEILVCLTAICCHLVLLWSLNAWIDAWQMSIALLLSTEWVPLSLKLACCFIFLRGHDLNARTICWFWDLKRLLIIVMRANTTSLVTHLSSL